jgi:hypothetical protein
MVVLCIAQQRQICLLSRPLSSLAKQAVTKEEPFFFYNSGSQCVLYKVCGNDCCTTTGGNSWEQFAIISVKDAVSSKNYVNYSSISRCVKEGTNSYYLMYLRYGKICCPSVNISMNKCYHCSGIYCYPFGDSSSVICSFSYSSFSDNTASNDICIYFNNGNSKFEMKCCNILRNSQVSSLNGILCVPGNTMIEDSCILENTANYIIYVWSSSPLTLSNCTIDTTTNYGSINIQNTVTKSFILGLNHMSTQNCNSEYDSAGYLTPIIQTPSPSKKQIHLRTCGNCLCQSRLGYLVALIGVFLFNFIHLVESNNPLY